jgi:hypothetical protein
MSKKQGIRKRPIQIYWDLRTRQDFERLLNEYDPVISINQGVLKLILWAINEHYLPGYERRPKPNAIPFKPPEKN